MKVALDKITLDERLQHREKLEDDLLVALKAAYKDGEPVEDVVLIFDGKTHWLPDGHHRYFACKAAGCDSINAVVYDGDYRAAFLYSLGVNAKHGSRRTAGDLARVLERCFADSELAYKPNKHIAKLCSCAETTVSRHRDLFNAREKVQPKIEAIEAPVGVKAPVIKSQSEKDEAKRRETQRACQRAFGQLAAALDQLGVFDASSKALAEIKHHAGLI